MALRLQVDQSSKVEQTNEPTVVAYSNEEQRALLVPAKVKQDVLARLRRRGHESKAAVLMVFAAIWSGVRRLYRRTCCSSGI